MWRPAIEWIWIRNTLLALACGFAGGYLFVNLHIPLPWTLGSLTAAAILAVFKIPWKLSLLFRNFARPTLGVMAGSSFTPAVALALITWWPAIPALLLFSILITTLGWVYFTRVCKQNNVTAVFSATPGGLGELSLLGSQLGGNIRVLVLVHTTRVITAVVCLPFLVRLIAHHSGAPMPVPHHANALPLTLADCALLISCGAAGFFIGRPFRRMGGIMLAPLMISIAVHVTGFSTASPPGWLIVIMQVIIGSIAGARFAGITALELRTTALQAFGWAIIMLSAAVLMAKVTTNFLNVSFPALILAFAPGGFSEMTILAYAMGYEIAFVVTCHVFRAVTVLLIAPTLSRVLAREGDKDRDEED
ncbi:monooxygenase [Terrihabitans soli]|uniref:Monooxygenase n=1 Tax=Terrihabitans soli TaxID=708113 RepID=A0A6S6QP37_9HYPH|nr:AbrB family transcriptional regulator [Terrihabitans soli]BCJ91236.1 monooxygenase [Terrihabitans soli]